MKHVKKLVTITLIIVLCVLVYYRYANKDRSGSDSDGTQDNTPEIEKVLNKNLDQYYPKTPLELVKFFTRIQKCYYNENPSDEEIEQLGALARQLFDEELLEENPEEEYYKSLKEEIEQYKKDDKTIDKVAFDKSSDVVYATVEDRKTATLNCVYYMRQGDRITTYEQTFIARKDEEGLWKIYGWKAYEPTELEK